MPRYDLKNWGEFEEAARSVGVKPDPTNPRASRLAVALALHGMEKPYEACYAMTGDPPHKRDDYTTLILSRGITGQSPKDFYESFPEADERILRGLTPQEAAEYIMQDIQGDPEKLEKFQALSTEGSDFPVGNSVFSRVYGTLMEGPLPDIDRSFKENVFYPLEFKLVSTDDERVLLDSYMITHMGKLAKVTVVP